MGWLESEKMTVPRVKSHSGIMKKAAKVETAVMVTDRSRLPPNISVQMLDAPPPGETPVTNRPRRIGADWKMAWRGKEEREGIKINPVPFEPELGHDQS